MATKQSTIRFCDRCGSDEDTEHFKVQYGPARKTFSFDACGPCKDETPLGEWISLRGVSGPGRRMSRKVVSLETVERAASGSRRRVRKG